MTTLALIQRAIVTENHWMSPDDFTHAWALCQLTPGINLIALAALIGKRLHGLVGIIVALSGMLIPSTAITIALTAGYLKYQHSPFIVSSMKSVLPAVAAIGLFTGFKMIIPVIQDCQKDGKIGIFGFLIVVVVSVTLLFVLRMPVIVALLLCGILSGVFSWARNLPAKPLDRQSQ